MAITAYFALGFVDLLVMQRFQGVREEPVASFRGAAQLSRDAIGPAGKELFREIAKVSSCRPHDGLRFGSDWHTPG